MIDGHTRLFGIIGDPVEHSLSPVMHNAAFSALGINSIYLPMKPTDLAEGLHGLRALGFQGASVTVPYKVAIIAMLDEIEPLAKRIGAVNTLVFQHSDSGFPLCKGLNTDWIGSNQALTEAFNPAGRPILIIGAGGAARAVGFGLLEAGAKVMLTNRTESKGQVLAAQLGCRFVSGHDLHTVHADALINTTSVGMAPHSDGIPINPEYLTHFSVVMDIVYAPLETRLLREAAARGCRTIDGLKMLQYQGAAQFRIWTGMEPPTQVMRTALLEGLALRAAA